MIRRLISVTPPSAHQVLLEPACLDVLHRCYQYAAFDVFNKVSLMYDVLEQSYCPDCISYEYLISYSHYSYSLQVRVLYDILYLIISLSVCLCVCLFSYLSVCPPNMPIGSHSHFTDLRCLTIQQGVSHVFNVWCQAPHSPLRPWSC